MSGHFGDGTLVGIVSCIAIMLVWNDLAKRNRDPLSVVAEGGNVAGSVPI